jgi:hypothetical protein
MGPKERRDSGQNDLFRARFDQWRFLEERFGAVYSRPSDSPPRARGPAGRGRAERIFPLVARPRRTCCRACDDLGIGFVPYSGGWTRSTASSYARHLGLDQIARDKGNDRPGARKRPRHRPTGGRRRGKAQRSPGDFLRYYNAGVLQDLTPHTRRRRDRAN